MELTRATYDFNEYDQFICKMMAAYSMKIRVPKGHETGRVINCPWIQQKRIEAGKLPRDQHEFEIRLSDIQALIEIRALVKLTELTDPQTDFGGWRERGYDGDVADWYAWNC